MTAFLTSGIVGAAEGLLGEPYEDAAGNTYTPLVVQPMIVLSADADADALKAIYHRAMDRGVRLSLYPYISKTCSPPATTPPTAQQCANTRPMP